MTSTGRCGSRRSLHETIELGFAILTDVHLWVPVVVLILGITLLMTLR